MKSAVSDDRFAHFARYEKDLDVLAAISAAIANESAQPELLRSVLRILEEGLGMRRGTVMLLQPDDKELVIGAVERLPESTPATPVIEPAKELLVRSYNQVSRRSFLASAMSLVSKIGSISEREKTSRT